MKWSLRQFYWRYMEDMGVGLGVVEVVDVGESGKAVKDMEEVDRLLLRQIQLAWVMVVWRR